MGKTPKLDIGGAPVRGVRISPWFSALPKPAKGLYALVLAGALGVPLLVRVPGDHLSLAALWRVLMVGALGITYSMVVRSPERVRRALARNYCPNLQGIWVVAAGVAVPTSLIPAIGAAAFGAEWWQRRRTVPRGEGRGDRYLFSAAAMVLAAELARLVAAGSLWLTPVLGVVADFIDVALILAIALIGTRGEGFRARIRVMIRSQKFDMAAIGVACATGLMVLLPGGGIVLAMAGLPLLIWVQQWSLSAELEPKRIKDRRTGLHLAEPWLAMAAEYGCWPGSVFFVGLRQGCGDEELGRAVEAMRARLRGEPLIGHYAHGLAAIDPELEPAMAGGVAHRLVEELHRRGVAAIVEVSAASSGPDLRAAIDDAVRVARKRVTLQASLQRLP